MIAADVAAWVGGSCGSVFRADTLSLRNGLTVRERSGALECRRARTSTEFAPKSATGKFQGGLACQESCRVQAR